MRHSCNSCSASRKPCSCDHADTPRRGSYTFKEGLTMMAAKAVGIDPYLAAEAGENAKAALNALRNAARVKNAKDRAGYIREAQSELRSISPAKHGKVINAIHAKLLALQGRGGDREIAHLTPGEVVVPRILQTPQLMRIIRAEAARQGINPARYTVGHKANHVNPKTGAREFGCNPGDPGECFNNWTDGWGPGHSITTIGYVKPEMPPNYTGGFPGVTYGGPNLPPNFGDGGGGDVGGESDQNALNLFYNMCGSGQYQSPCCEKKDSKIEPPLWEVPSQRVLDGLDAFEIEGSMKTYNFIADTIDYTNNVIDLRSAIRSAIEGASSEAVKSILEVFDRMLGDRDSPDTWSGRARGIAEAYRNELRTRMATCDYVRV